MTEEEYLATLARNIETQINELNDLEGRIIREKELLGDAINHKGLLQAIYQNKLKLANLLKLK